MLDEVRSALSGRDAWLVGGAVRDRRLGRPVVDVDVVCLDPEQAARAVASRAGGAPFALSPEHGSWRVVLGGGTVDVTPLHGTIEEDLGRRDFTINAMAEPLAGGSLVDPHGGVADLEASAVRHVSDSVFEDDPLRLLRAVRIAGQLGFEIAPETEALVRARAPLVASAAGERVLAELEQLRTDDFVRLDELGLLEPLGGRLPQPQLSDGEPPDLRLVRIFGPRLERLPISNQLRRFLRVLLRARPPSGGSPREIHRFRRETEPWALEALAYLGADELREQVLAARESEPVEPLVRGDELGVPPGPEIGRLLERIAEERAAGTISTREEALELARRERRV
jgi:tRNA nucleotidyltransferase/poly(A) polymerase